MNTATEYRTKEVCRIACVTARQLQWWDERNLLSPQQKGHTRVYHRREVFQALLFRELRERGLSLQQIRKIASDLARRKFDGLAPQSRWLLTNGQSVVLLDGHAEVLAFLSQRRVPVFVLVDLAAVAARLESAIDTVEQQRRPPRPASTLHFTTTFRPEAKIA